MAYADTTLPRTVRMKKCALYAPTLPIDTGFDLLPFVQKLDIFESIFDATISGTLVLLENIGLIEFVPIVGTEVVVVVFEVDDPTTNSVHAYAVGFRVVRAGEVTYPKNDYRFYTLQLATHEFVTSVSSRVCLGIRGKTCAEAVKEIAATSFGEAVAQQMTIEPTYGKLDVVIPNYTPLRAIDFLAARALTVAPPRESNFVFFQTLNSANTAAFQFVSVRQLITEGLAKDRLTFRVDPGQVSTQPFVSDEVARHSISRMHTSQTFDLLDDIQQGVLRSKMVHFDFLARRVSHEDDSRYTTSFANTTHLAAHPVYPRNFDQTVSKNVKLFTVPSNLWSSKSSYINSIEPDQPEHLMRESVVLRNRQLHELLHFRTLLDVPGQPQLRAGAVIDVFYPSSRTLSGTTAPQNAPYYTQGSPRYSGPHLITALRHVFSPTGAGTFFYRMHLEACRDSFNAPLMDMKAT